MSNENLDQDALATEEMLKMFESIEVDDSQSADEAIESDDLLDNLSLNDDSTETTDDVIALQDDLEALPTMDLMDTTDTELLEIADNDETTQLLEGLDSLEENDELAGLSFDEAPTNSFSQSSDEEFPVVNLENDESISEADTLEVDDVVMSEMNPDEMTPTEIATTSPTISLNDTTPIAEHLQAVVANAIQALQDWMQLRQEGEHKGPQQSLAQLDVLLDTVTNQQQQLAEQLANSPQKQLTQISSALGVTLATPQTLGWTDDDWRVKAQQVADKTDDISQRNAKIRQELAHL
ncbi:MAG: hypothetical protein B7Z48_03775 [Thiotrichales bacterium 12-47-6]|nr:MAG: hypothetical protein B7Z48_03775 [Thiotrichales bacterium 12-47-6]UCG18110.1 MAG: hypothetical protein JSU84_06080 [Thiotrichales bacterium]